MDELDKSRSFNVSVAVIIAGPARQNHQQGPQAFAASGDDVFGNAVHQGYRALQPRPDDRVHGGEVGVDDGTDFYEGHGCQGCINWGIVADRVLARKSA